MSRMCPQPQQHYTQHCPHEGMAVTQRDITAPESDPAFGGRGTLPGCLHVLVTMGTKPRHIVGALCPSRCVLTSRVPKDATIVCSHACIHRGCTSLLATNRNPITLLDPGDQDRISIHEDTWHCAPDLTVPSTLRAPTRPALFCHCSGTNPCQGTPLPWQSPTPASPFRESPEVTNVGVGDRRSPAGMERSCQLRGS